MKNETATLVGWHADRNAGDDAMLYVIAALLQARYGVKTLQLLASPATLPAFAPPDVRYKPIDLSLGGRLGAMLNRQLRLRAVRRGEGLFFGGGTIFHSLNSIAWKAELLDSFRRAQPQRQAGALGVSLGPFKDKAAEEKCALFLQKLDFLIVRDRPSFAFASQLSLPYAPVLSHDLALLLPEAAKKPLPPQARKTKHLGVSLRLLAQEKEVAAKRLEEILTALGQLWEKKEIEKISLFSFCESASPAHSDRLLLTQLKAALPNTLPVEIIPYEGDPLQTLNKISTCAAFLGMRLHSQVFCYMLGVPCVALDYQRKCRDFLSGVGVDERLALSAQTANAAEMEERLAMALSGQAMAPTPWAQAVQASHEALASTGFFLRNER